MGSVWDCPGLNSATSMPTATSSCSVSAPLSGPGKTSVLSSAPATNSARKLLSARSRTTAGTPPTPTGGSSLPSRNACLFTVRTMAPASAGNQTTTRTLLLKTTAILDSTARVDLPSRRTNSLPAAQLQITLSSWAKKSPLRSRATPPKTRSSASCSST